MSNSGLTPSAGAGAPGGSDAVHQAHRGLRSGLALRAVLSLVGAVVLVFAAVAVARMGMQRHTFPGFIPGQAHAVITSYSGPLLAGAIGIGAVAGLLLVSAVTDWWRRRLIGPAPTVSHPRLEQ